MLVNLHAHELTYGMFDHHPHWGPSIIEGNRLKVGNWILGDKVEGRPHPAESFSRENQLKRMEERGIDKLVVCQPAHLFMYWAGDYGTEFARIVNDELATFCADEPDKFYFWALAPLGDPDAAPAELERAVKELGAVGMMMGGDEPRRSRGPPCVLRPGLGEADRARRPGVRPRVQPIGGARLARGRIRPRRLSSA